LSIRAILPPHIVRVGPHGRHGDHIQGKYVPALDILAHRFCGIGGDQTVLRRVEKGAVAKHRIILALGFELIHKRISCEIENIESEKRNGVQPPPGK
jgi:hypothetical protein